jgi:hypothetical protein
MCKLKHCGVWPGSNQELTDLAAEILVNTVTELSLRLKIYVRSEDSPGDFPQCLVSLTVY